jgi:YgiT-type zinc finger domain-containing protein
MAGLYATEVLMFECHVCHARESRQELVDELFHIDHKPVMVEHIPATVCARCGEKTFSRETTEKIRLIVHGGAKPVKAITMDVFAYV